MEKTPTYQLLKNEPRQGLKILYERYGQRLYGYAVHSWKLTEDEAWELIYQLLFNVCSKIVQYTFTDEKAFASFLFTSFMNLLRNHIRDQKRIGIQALEADTEAYVIADSMEEIDSNGLTLLKEELDKLQDWERILLLLRCQDMPYAEIARYTDKPASVLKVYYGRLKEKLGRQLKIKTPKSTEE